MAKKKAGPTLQQYPREGDALLAITSLFPRLDPPMDEHIIEEAIDAAFQRCIKNKKGEQVESKAQVCANYQKLGYRSNFRS